MKLPLDKAAIEAILPHRDPFLLLDEVTELRPGARVVRSSSLRRRTVPATSPGTRSCPA